MEHGGSSITRGSQGSQGPLPRSSRRIAWRSYAYLLPPPLGLPRANSTDNDSSAYVAAEASRLDEGGVEPA